MQPASSSFCLGNWAAQLTGVRSRVPYRQHVSRSRSTATPTKQVLVVTGSSIMEDWTRRWLMAVADGSLTMSQRTMWSVVQHGGLEQTVAVARSLHVHLGIVTDDRGVDLVIASVHPIRTLC